MENKRRNLYQAIVHITAGNIMTSIRDLDDQTEFPNTQAIYVGPLGDVAIAAGEFVEYYKAKISRDQGFELGRKIRINN